MKSLTRVAAAVELLDAPRHDTRELEQSLAHVAAVNRWLGGVHSVLQHLEPHMARERTTRILDVGTGSGDVPQAIVRWAHANRRTVEIIATDLHPQMREIADQHTKDYPEISIEAADARRLPYADGSFDVVLLTLTLHHFDDAEQLLVLRELTRVARSAVIVSELHRTRLNYLGALLLSWTYWRGNSLTRHDGPLSVLRAFTAEELAAVAAKAGLRAGVYKHFFQRLVLVIDAAAETSARLEAT